ncbi:arogenate dehydrogenase [Corynebacterium ciconiae DSM 44920]|nr:arogenate dehydrogenase [Corynebacterium ciconiae DSM 44920]
MRVSIISAGRVGTAIGEKLAAAGHHIYNAVAPSPESLERAYARLPHAAIASCGTAASRAQLLVLAVPDPQLAAVVEEITPHVQPRQIVLHTSGSHGVEVLAPLAERGALTIAAHPAMTFSGTDADVERLDGCGWGVTTGDDLTATVAELLITEMNGRAIAIAEQHRALYHAAMAHASNHAAAIAAQARELVEQCAVQDDSDTARRLLGPLMQQSIAAALDGGWEAITGPAARDDAAAVRRHLEVIGTGPVRDSYVALARAIAEQSGAQGVLVASTSE